MSAQSRYGAAHVVVRPIYSSHLLQLLGPPAYAWMWRGRHGAGTGHGSRVGATVRAHDTKWRGPRCGARDTVRAQDTERHGSLHEAGVAGAAIWDASPIRMCGH